MNLSNTSIIAGRMVTQLITPRITPFAITIPRSIPSLYVIKQSATKPATVVIELPTTALKVLLTASAIASWSSSIISLSSSYLCHKNIE